MSDAGESVKSKAAYLLGHSEHEIQRLKTQARLIDPITRRFFAEAGIAPGMRVLDVGSGAGDVAFLAADLVGAGGEVVGIDRVAGAIDAARERASVRTMPNVTFRVGDPGDLTFERPFDAVIGRYVLQFQKSPDAMLRRVSGFLKPDGLVAFHEIDWSGLASFPPAPTFDRCCAWGLQTLRLHGTEARVGSKLHTSFVKAGLSAPSIRVEAMAGGGTRAADVMRIMADLAVTLVPEMERLGVSSAREVGIDGLFDRMQREVLANESFLVGHLQVGAWSRIPA